MTKYALVAPLMLAILSVRGSAVNAQKPGDACALLQAAQIQALAGSGKPGSGQPSSDPLGSRLCRYQWGTGATVQGGQSILDERHAASRPTPAQTSVLRQGPRDGKPATPTPR
jgi:hypothetical protein